MQFMSNCTYSLSLPQVCPEMAARVEAVFEKHAETVEASVKHIVADTADSTAYVYYLKSGKTSHFLTNGTDSKLLYQMTAGNVFGNVLPEGMDCVATIVKVAEKAVILRMTRESYLSLLAADSQFAMDMFKLNAMSGVHMANEIANLSFNSCKTRLMKIYCSQADTSSPVDDGKWYPVRSKLTHDELSDIVGSARVTISKLINELCNDGFIRTINRRAQVNVEAYNAFIACEGK